jgi:2Fe-2S ferredoxin
MPKIKFIFDDSERIADVHEGSTILDAARSCDVPLEGACEGSLACSTCHVIVQKDFFDKLSKASDEEDDMLDLAFGLTKTSRLGCQVVITNELDGIVVSLPSCTRNINI